MNRPLTDGPLRYKIYQLLNLNQRNDILGDKREKHGNTGESRTIHSGSNG
jgi:hypothetical protein